MDDSDDLDLFKDPDPFDDGESPVKRGKRFGIIQCCY